MSKFTRRKHVMKEMMEDNFDAPTEKQQIVRVIGGRGNNLHEVESANEDQPNFLVSMPTKFRRNIWIQRGNFILIESIEEGNKVKGEIVRILTPDHTVEYKKLGIWPDRFQIKTEELNSHSDDDDDDENLFRNQNRPNLMEQSDDDSDISCTDNIDGTDSDSDSESKSK